MSRLLEAERELQFQSAVKVGSPIRDLVALGGTMGNMVGYSIYCGLDCHNGFIYSVPFSAAATKITTSFRVS